MIRFSNNHPIKKHSLLIASLFLCIAGRCNALLSVVSGLSSQATLEDASVAIKTATFKYYGIQDHVNVSAPALFLKNPCRLDPDRVAGHIVYVERPMSDPGYSCSRVLMYKKLSDAGAVGFVQPSVMRPPGYDAYHHLSWKPEKVQKRLQLVIVEVYKGDIDFDLWRDSPSLVLKISGPHDRSWEKLFTSPAWIVCVRVLAPLFALRVAFCGVRAIKRLRARPEIIEQEFGILALIICYFECTTTCILGTLAALGNWGPNLLPTPYHSIGYFYFSGSSVLSTSFIIVFMFEQLRIAPPRRLPKRSLWKHNKIKLIGFAISFISIDVLAAVFMIVGISESRMVFLFINVAIVTAVTFSIALFYYWHASKVARPIIKSLRERRRQRAIPITHDGPEKAIYLKECEIQRKAEVIVYRLVINGSCVLLLLLGCILWVIIVTAKKVNSGYFIFVVLYFFARTSLSYCNIMSVTPRAQHHDPNLSLFPRQLSGCLRRKISPDHHHAGEDPRNSNGFSTITTQPGWISGFEIGSPSAFAATTGNPHDKGSTKKVTWAD